MDDPRLVRVLKALADRNRFRIVQQIARAGELSCGEVGERFDLAQPTISHHLKILADAGILAVRRVGQHGIISVDHALLDEALGLILGRLGTKHLGPRSRPKVKSAPPSRDRSRATRRARRPGSLKKGGPVERDS